MNYPKVNLYADVAPYVKPDAQDVAQTPEADGWRAPNIPEKIANTSVQQYRDFTNESIHWGLQTVITPMLQQMITLLSGSAVKNASIEFLIGADMTENIQQGTIVSANGDGIFEGRLWELELGSQGVILGADLVYEHYNSLTGYVMSNTGKDQSGYTLLLFSQNLRAATWNTCKTNPLLSATPLTSINLSLIEDVNETACFFKSANTTPIAFAANSKTQKIYACLVINGTMVNNNQIDSGRFKINISYTN